MPPKTRRQAARDSISRGFSDNTVTRVIAEGQLPKGAKPRPPPQDISADLTVNATAGPARRDSEWDEPVELPTFTIDLALPPEQRWLEVCTAMQDEIQGITGLFDEVVGGMLPFLPLRWVHRICAFFLRGIANKEENRELKGVSAATGVGIYLLVCLNVLLDIFLGCSSGGVRVRDPDSGAKMVHFRTLDWGMPALRRILVRLDYKYGTDGDVFASVITYAGFTGVLTGVRKDLSMSLNFRPNHNDSHLRWANFQYRWQQAMVMLGFRPSIASRLRECLLTPTLSLSKREETLRSQLSQASYDQIIHHMSGYTLSTTSCYLIFINGTSTTILERDRISARKRSDAQFIIATNSDQDATIDEPEEETSTTTTTNPSDGIPKEKPPIQRATLAEIIRDAKDRAQCAESNYNKRLAQSEGGVLGIGDVVEMIQLYPTTNETTHFACVMDPREGRVVWCRAWMEPVGARWIRAHLSDAY